jgi:2-polyprenyl-3-methyl-5-hydroxy-6-metoxy-1,4-benzoquinol methylase
LHNGELPGWTYGALQKSDDFRVKERDKQRALQYFAAKSSHYYRTVERGPLKWLRKRERNAVLQLAAFQPGRTMLDVGCGQGYYAIEAKRSGMKVCALDVVPEMLASLLPSVDSVQLGDIEDFQTDFQYDCVVCAGVLDFVLKPEQAFLNLSRLVAPGGRLVVLVPRSGPGSLLYRLEKLAYGMRINFFSVGWFVRLSAGTPLSVCSWIHPLPFNTAVLLEHRQPGLRQHTTPLSLEFHLAQ